MLHLVNRILAAPKWKAVRWRTRRGECVPAPAPGRTHKESYDAFMRQAADPDCRYSRGQPAAVHPGESALPGRYRSAKAAGIKNWQLPGAQRFTICAGIIMQAAWPAGCGWQKRCTNCFTLSEAVDGAGAGCYHRLRGDYRYRLRRRDRRSSTCCSAAPNAIAGGVGA